MEECSQLQFPVKKSIYQISPHDFWSAGFGHPVTATDPLQVGTGISNNPLRSVLEKAFANCSRGLGVVDRKKFALGDDEFKLHLTETS